MRTMDASVICNGDVTSARPSMKNSAFRICMLIYFSPTSETHKFWAKSHFDICRTYQSLVHSQPIIEFKAEKYHTIIFGEMKLFNVISSFANHFKCFFRLPLMGLRDELLRRVE